MKTTLINLRNYKGTDVIYIDRRSIFGNPYPIRAGCTRRQSIIKYRRYFYKRIREDGEFRKKVRELAGHKIACWCTPLHCHGDVIIEYLELLETCKEAIK